MKEIIIIADPAFAVFYPKTLGSEKISFRIPDFLRKQKFAIFCYTKIIMILLIINMFSASD
jgi:hypothetical protein